MDLNKCSNLGMKKLTHSLKNLDPQRKLATIIFILLSMQESYFYLSYM